MTVTAPDAAADERRDALVGRLFEATLGAFDLLAIHLGDQLGLYRALAERGPLTAPHLAAATGVTPRYAREWLEHQAVASILDVDDPAAAPGERRYALPAGHAEVLVDETSLAFMAPMAQWVVAGGKSMGDLVDAYRTGGGVPWDRHQDVVIAQDRINRPAFTHLLAQEWLPAHGDLHERLLADGGRIADVACGTGWSTIALARAYPKAFVDGLDLDRGSIETARERLASDALDVADRVTFHARDAGDPGLAGRYDLALILEAVHDMANPVPVLAAVRNLLAPGGALVIADEKVAETFGAPGDEVERLMYSYSVLYCLPNSLAEAGSVATGTVLRPSRMRELAAEAGFSSVSIVPIEHDTFRFYRLEP
ncbi:MAG TPA: methyltransferase [Candidatus Limnocylindrales bacterium]|nr:methyltransferase [Candidatus Limnocylindrales bacterium]